MTEPAIDMQAQTWFHVANWKMNKTIRQAQDFVEQITPKVVDLQSPLWIGAPFTALSSLRELQKTHSFVLGAQNMNDATEGAFTGEIAASMLKEVGAQFVILGHSERRRYFNESDDFIARKVVRAMASHLFPLLCIGETFEERQANQTMQVLKKQLEAVFDKACPNGLKELLIAYEPVWAVGTGLSATNEDVEKALEQIYALAAQYTVNVKVLYGGSVSQKNVESLASISQLNGFLVGGASLNVESFAKIATLGENTHFKR